MDTPVTASTYPSPSMPSSRRLGSYAPPIKFLATPVLYLAGLAVNISITSLLADGDVGYLTMLTLNAYATSDINSLLYNRPTC